jgi:hypothetical protein
MFSSKTRFFSGIKSLARDFGLIPPVSGGAA